MCPRMTDDQENKREVVENIQTTLGVMRVQLGMVSERVQQARRISGLQWLLEPVESRLCDWEDKIIGIQRELRRVWEEGNQSGWNTYT